MITATVTIENQWKRGEVDTYGVDFETIGEIENYLAYNRAYIKGITFQGEIKIQEEVA